VVLSVGQRKKPRGGAVAGKDLSVQRIVWFIYFLERAGPVFGRKVLTGHRGRELAFSPHNYMTLNLNGGKCRFVISRQEERAK